MLVLSGLLKQGIRFWRTNRVIPSGILFIMDNYLYLLLAAVAGLIVGYCFEGNRTPGKELSPREKFFKIIKWVSVIIIALYILIVVAALTDGIGDLPLLGGGYVWVRGHWRRR